MILSTVSYAELMQYGERYGTNNQSGYQGDSGNNYQYDMNDQSDRNDYSYDTDAQRRDSMYQDIGGGRSQDQGYGQNGGGIYD